MIYRRILLLAIIACTFVIHVDAQTWYRQNGGSVIDSHKHYTSVVNDSPGVIVTNSGMFHLYHSSVITSGNSSQTDSSSINGLNAGVLVKGNSFCDFLYDTVYTTGSGANALYATGSGSSISMMSGKILTTNRRAHGVAVTNSGSATITNTEIYTSGDTASAVAVDYGGGTINVDGGTLTAAGHLSPGIYATAFINVNNATVSSLADHGAVADADGHIYITNTTVTATRSGFAAYNSRGASSTATMELTGGSLSANDHAFYDSATTVNMLAKGGAAIVAGSGYLLYTVAAGTMNFTAKKETMTGDVYADTASTINAVLQDTTTLTGRIINASVSLDATSEWIVTDTSHINVLTDAAGVNLTAHTVDNITGNGRNVYYKASLPGNGWLGGSSYSLVGGGCLLPEGSVCGVAGVQSPGGIDNISHVYPNPASHELFISLPPVHYATTIEVLSADGRVQADANLAAGETVVNINVSRFAAGLYLLVITRNESRQLLKFTKN